MLTMQKLSDADISEQLMELPNLKDRAEKGIWKDAVNILR